MEQTAEAVIIGAGIMGCSVAYHLAARGVRDILVLERDQIARGSTSDAAGGIRLQFSSPTNIELAQRSLDVWQHFEERFGVDIGLRQQGYLFLLRSEPEVAEFHKNLRLQQSLGVPARWVTPEEIHELNPVIVLDDVLGGTFCPRDGWADPFTATMGFASAARRLGVEIRQHTPVTGIAVTGERVTGVETSGGRIAAPLVIICAGARTRGVGNMAGVEIPVDPYRRMSFVTEPFPAVPSTIPMTIDFQTSLYFHPEGPGFLFGMSNPEEPSSFRRTVEDEWLLRCVEELAKRAPVFEEARVKTGWAGLYEITPDDNPVLGYLDEVSGLVVAAGFSGHGFMQGPAIGACMAELILDGRATTADIRPFAPARFREGRLAQEHNVV